MTISFFIDDDLTNLTGFVANVSGKRYFGKDRNGNSIYEGDTLLNHKKGIEKIATIAGRTVKVTWGEVRDDYLMDENGNYMSPPKYIGFNISQSDSGDYEIITEAAPE